MHHKHQAGLHEAKRQRGIEAGKPDIGPYTAGPSVPGLAPKTARYTLGMLGAGNIHVPDTHFARYIFGLEKGRGKDNKTIEYLKNTLWAHNNAHVLEGIDRYYAKHHDAVKHMMQHPEFKHLFDSPEDAIFPAFWKNWVGIVAHEKARGMNTAGFNEVTDHRPFWETTQPAVDQALSTIKSEGHDPEAVAMRTAHQHAAWVEQYGEMPASMLYFARLVPQLLAHYQENDVEGENHSIQPDENAAQFEGPTDLSPTEGLSRPFGIQPHVLPAHAYLPSPTFGKEEWRPTHPAVSGGHYAILTGESPRFPVQTQGENGTLEQELHQRGMKFEKVRGKYGGLENSYLVHQPNLNHITDMARRYGQESVLYAKGNQAHLIYTHGPYAGKMHNSDKLHVYPQQPLDHFTTIPGAGKGGADLNFTWDPDWNTFHDAKELHPAPPVEKSDDELAEELLIKWEYLRVELETDLRKAQIGNNPAQASLGVGGQMSKPPQAELMPTVGAAGPIHFQGKQVVPGDINVYPQANGAAALKNRPVPHKLLAHTPSGGALAVRADKFGHHGPADIVHIPPKHFEVVKPLEDAAPDTTGANVVNSLVHGDWRYNRTPESSDLINGTDMGRASQVEPPRTHDLHNPGVNAMRSSWHKMANGKLAYVKGDGGEKGDDFSEPKREAAYSNLAKDVFGLGEYVPNVAVFRHPKTGQEMAAIEHVGGQHIQMAHSKYEDPKPKGPHAQTIKQLGDSGELDKLAMMNNITGNFDRHSRNYMMTGQGKGLKLIDHGFNFASDHKVPKFDLSHLTPHYIHAYNALQGEGSQHEPVHPAAQEWLHGLDENKLATHMRDMGIPEDHVNEAAYRLKNLKAHLGRYPYLSRERALQSHLTPAEGLDDSWYSNWNPTGGE
jgi:hypothetical protein